MIFSIYCKHYVSKLTETGFEGIISPLYVALCGHSQKRMRFTPNWIHINNENFVKIYVSMLTLRIRNPEVVEQKQRPSLRTRPPPLS